MHREANSLFLFCFINCMMFRFNHTKFHCTQWKHDPTMQHEILFFACFFTNVSPFEGKAMTHPVCVSNAHPSAVQASAGVLIIISRGDVILHYNLFNSAIIKLLWSRLVSNLFKLLCSTDVEFIWVTTLSLWTKHKVMHYFTSTHAMCSLAMLIASRICIDVLKILRVISIQDKDVSRSLSQLNSCLNWKISMMLLTLLLLMMLKTADANNNVGNDNNHNHDCTHVVLTKLLIFLCCEN